MRNVNKTFLYILHSIYFMLEGVLIFLLISDNIFKIKTAVNYKSIIILSLLFYFIAFILSEIYEKRRYINLLESKMFIIAGVSASIIAGAFIGFEQGIFISLFITVYFTFILINAIRINSDHYYKSVSSSAHFKIIKAFLFTALMASFYIPDNRYLAFGNKVIDLVNIYFAVSILHSVCVNLNKHFEASKAVNKDKNLFIFNFTFVFFIIAIIFARKEIIFLLEMAANFINTNTDAFLHKMVTGMSNFLEKFFGTGFGAFLVKFLGRTANNEAPTEDEPLITEEEIEKLTEEMAENKGDLVIFKIIYLALFIGILFISYRYIKKHVHKKQRKGTDEKEFIFKKEDLLNDIKDSFINMFKKREHISKERLVYKKTVNELIRDGYEIYKITTPNEYISTIVDEDIEKYNFYNVTSDYNADRYGKS